jgi:exodeoxyribonuclease-3
MKIATFNVNSIKARLPRVLEWLDQATPDIVCLQEIKCLDENFPALEIEDKGYNLAVHGQKTYNGVALLSKFPIEDVTRGLPGNEDDPQARYLEAFTGGLRVASIYLPNGNPRPGEKFAYKLDWMAHLAARAKAILEWEEPVVLAGDYNVIPKDEDCFDPGAWREDALTQPEVRARFRELLFMGYTDALRQIRPSGTDYTFWDYQRGAWPKDNGLRIDHLLLSPQAADRLQDCQIDRAPRGGERASDHTPIWCEIDL